MALKKVNFKEDEEALFDNAVIYKRGEYWHMRMWLPKEHKYARFSLKTRNKSTAKDKAELHYHELKVLEKSGKTYFSHTTKIGVEMYLEERKKDVEAGINSHTHVISQGAQRQSHHHGENGPRHQLWLVFA